METEDYFSPLTCTDRDFDSVMEITGVLIKHTMQILERLEKRKSNSPADGSALSRIKVFFNELPEEFDCQERVELSLRLGIPPKTSEKWITKLCSDGGPLERAERGKYRKRAVEYVLFSAPTCMLGLINMCAYIRLKTPTILSVLVESTQVIVLKFSVLNKQAAII